MIRDKCGFAAEPWFPVVEVLERALDVFAPGFSWDIRLPQELGRDHGLTDHEKKVIFIREDVYLGATEGIGRDRGTIGHEIGHAVLHGPGRLARRMPDEPPPPAYQCVEWQAKCFAGELLVDCRQLAGCRSPSDIARKFGVSNQSAATQMKAAGTWMKKAALGDQTQAAFDFQSGLGLAGLKVALNGPHLQK